MPNRLAPYLALLIVLLYITVGVLFAWRVPAWQAPDEPAHYNVIAQMADGVLLPVIEMGDWDNAYLEQLKADDFAPALLDDLDTVQYEDHQPPLYYWLQTPIFSLTDGSLLALRIASVLMGAITVGTSWLITRRLLPDRPYVALTVMLLVGFIPQQMHILASINNDALAGALIALTLWALVRYLQDTGLSEWWLGALLALIVITKTTAYFMAGVVLVALWLKRGNDWRSLLRVTVPAGLMAALYWGRNIIVYGVPDFLGLGAHDAVVTGQLRTADLVAELGTGGYLQRAVQTTYHSFWGQFGWMEARLADALPFALWLASALVIVALVGLLVALWQGRQKTSQSASPPRLDWRIWSILALVIGLSLLQFVYYNTQFVQFQGRYLFTAIIPLALLVALGLDAWRVHFLERAVWLTPLLWLWLIPLDLYLIWRVIPGAVGGI